MTDAGLAWQGELQLLLESYLRKLGIVSSEVRARWVGHVLHWLQRHLREVPADDIAEQAVEHLREALDSRLAQVVGLDPVLQRGEVAQVFAVLQHEKYTELLNILFADFEGEIDSGTRAQLRAAIDADGPRPVPANAPLDMPKQPIELRSMNPLSWLFKATR
jgi:hypothetical protein